MMRGPEILPCMAVFYACAHFSMASNFGEFPGRGNFKQSQSHVSKFGEFPGRDTHKPRRVSNFGEFPGRHSDKLRRSNCTQCSERLQLKVSVLPRLTLIKDRILKALGRSSVTAQIGKSETESPQQTPFRPNIPSTPSPQTRKSYRMNEIITFSESSRKDKGDAVLKFRIQQQNSNPDHQEAVGASLLFYVNRRRKIRKGGKGKKIFLEISRLKSDNETWESLTFLRTRVKKRRWKRVSLPINVAQQLLESDNRTLDLKVKCTGCGRLVQLAFNKYLRKARKKRKHRRKSGNDETRVKRRRKPVHRKHRNVSVNPILVISTRYRV